MAKLRSCFPEFQVLVIFYIFTYHYRIFIESNDTEEYRKLHGFTGINSEIENICVQMFQARQLRHEGRKSNFMDSILPCATAK